MLQLQQVSRKQTYMRLALQGPSGSGLTYSALQIAYGLSGDYSKVAIIDTHENSTSFYHHLGAFSTIQMGVPFHPDRFYEALTLCEAADMQVVIIDSLSSEWANEGGMMDLLSGSCYEEALRAHRNLFREISESSMHIICTLRSKYSLVHVKSPSGKWRRKLYPRPLQQEGIEYLFTTMFRLDKAYRAHVVKDRTSIFQGKKPFLINEEIGSWLAGWCREGEPFLSEELQEQLNACQTVPELHRLLSQVKIDDVELIQAFTRRRLQLEGIEPSPLVKVQGGLL